MANSVGYHEPLEALPEDVVDRHRMITSLQEELEAVDWYDQRVSATANPEVAEILAHNRDEEKEHAAMVLEWLRRNDAGWDEHLRTYLFTEGAIVGLEAAEDGESSAASMGGGRAAVAGSLGIGSLKGVEQ